jgi:hypothetical protein
MCICHETPYPCSGEGGESLHVCCHLGALDVPEHDGQDRTLIVRTLQCQHRSRHHGRTCTHKRREAHTQESAPKAMVSRKSGPLTAAATAQSMDGLLGGMCLTDSAVALGSVTFNLSTAQQQCKRQAVVPFSECMYVVSVQCKCPYNVILSPRSCRVNGTSWWGLPQ